MDNEIAQDAAVANTLAIIDSSSPGIREILSSVVNVSESGLYYEPSCRFCSSPRRAEAEKLISSFDPLSKPIESEEKVVKFFASFGENLGSDIIRNHINSHMNRGDSEIKKAEYISRLASLTGGQMTPMSQAKLGIATVLECIGSVGTIAPNKNLSPAKAVEMKASVITKLTKSLTDLMTIQAKLNGELWDEGKMIAIPVYDFQRVFDDALNSAKTQDERKLISSVLDGLTTAIQK